jgi:hypothetical protein
MIGQTRQRHTMLGGMHQPTRKILAHRHQEGGVVEAGRTARGIGCASSTSSVTPLAPS